MTARVPDPAIGPPDPTEPDAAMPPDGDAAVAAMTHEVETDDMADPMAR